MTLRLRLFFGTLAFFAVSNLAEAGWRDVAEITLTLPKGTSKAAEGHYVRVTFLKDGTAVKRDFTGGAVFSGVQPKGAFETLAKAVDGEGAFGTAPEGEIQNPVKEAVIVKGNERKKFRLPGSQKTPALSQIEGAIDAIKWTKI